MDEDQILQSIIANPDLVDPTIDVSKLRQSTPTDPRLLGRVSGIQGLKFDPTRTDYIRDLYSVYGGGLPTIDIEPKVVAPVVDTTPIIDTTPVVDVGGGGGGGGQGQATSGVDTTPDTGLTDFEQNLIDQGIGVQASPGDPVGAAFEAPLTQKAIDELAAYPITPSLDDIDLGNPLNDPRIQPEEFGLVGTPEYIDPIMDPNLMDIRRQQAIDFAPEQQGLISQAFSKVGSTAGDIMNNLSQIPGAVADFTDQTVDVFGKKINVGKTLLKAGINKIVGGPITLVFDALGAIQSDPIDAATKEGLEEKGYGFDDIGRLTTGPMAGYNVESAFGDGIADATLDRIDKIENRDAPQTEDSIEKVEELYDFLGDVTGVKAEEFGPQEDIGAISGDMNTGADPVSGDLPGGGNIGDEFGSRGDTQATTGPTVSRSDTDYGQFGRAQSAQAGGGGNQGGGGKIVCTMMNDSYGFGSFRNKIWLKHSKDLAPEYQIGYHKIFLPLVKLSKTNKVLKKTLEHIAVHRTIDIRQEARGKMHLLGRVYRKILEPICYIVGKHAKR